MWYTIVYMSPFYPFPLMTHGLDLQEKLYYLSNLSFEIKIIWQGKSEDLFKVFGDNNG